MVYWTSKWSHLYNIQIFKIKEGLYAWRWNMVNLPFPVSCVCMWIDIAWYIYDFIFLIIDFIIWIVIYLPCSVSLWFVFVFEISCENELYKKWRCWHLSKTTTTTWTLEEGAIIWYFVCITALNNLRWHKP
jgi:hypothetical protein